MDSIDCLSVLKNCSENRNRENTLPGSGSALKR